MQTQENKKPTRYAVPWQIQGVSIIEAESVEDAIRKFMLLNEKQLAEDGELESFEPVRADL